MRLRWREKRSAEQSRENRGKTRAEKGGDERCKGAQKQSRNAHAEAQSLKPAEISA